MKKNLKQNGNKLKLNTLFLGDGVQIVIMELL